MVYINVTPPTEPLVGKLWYKSDEATLYIYYSDDDSNQWVGITATSGSNTGSTNGLTGGGYSRTIVSGTTDELSNGDTGNITITGFKAYMLFYVETSCESWVRIYVDENSRTNDSTRDQYTDPLPGTGIVSETITTTGSLSQLYTPIVYGFNNDDPVGTNMYLSVTNLNNDPQNVTVIFKILQMEI